MNEHVEHRTTNPIAVFRPNLSRMLKTFVIVLFEFAVFASAVAAQSVNVKLTLNNPTVADVIERLHRQTGYEFSYDAGILSGKLTDVSVDARNERIETVLSQVFGKSDITFRVLNNRVFLKSNKKSEMQMSTLANTTQQPGTRKISGTINDNKGEPIIGATIVEKGNPSIGTISDTDGNFTLQVVHNAVLQITYVGYETQEINTAGRNTFHIVLQEDTKTLDELVVVGYGTMRKRDLTGSVVQLSPDAFKEQPVLNTTSALQGRIAGVNISNTSGAPGGEVKIRIRGSNSVNNDNAPLIVLDGVAMGSLGLQDINPYDIASINVLKDASATAVYGARGANGVVLITTKAGKSDMVNVDFKSYLSYNTPIRKYSLMSASEYANYANLLSENKAFPNGFSAAGTNWQNMIFNEEKWTQNYQLSVTGGNKQMRYYVSGFYQSQPGTLLNSKMNKGGLRSNLDFRITDKLSSSVSIYLDRAYRLNTGGLGSKGNAVMSSLVWDPASPVYVDNNPENGYVRHVLSPIWSNPYMLLKESLTENFGSAGFVNGKITYQFTDNLKLDVNAGLDAYINRNGSVSNDWVSQGNMKSGQSYGESYTLQNSNMLTYQKAFDKHDITLTGLFENTRNETRGFGANGSELSSLTNGYDNLGLNKTQSISSNYSNWGILSYMARAAYNYDNRYLLTATVRRDGSSKFQGKNKWGTFPSFGLGWNLGNEAFLKVLDIFDVLKIRAGWGVTGNQNITPYGTLGLLSPGLYSYGTTNAQTAYMAGDPQAPGLKWETSVQTNIGLDLGFLDNALNITFDYYNKDTRDLLLYTKINMYDGGGNLLKNIGKVNNKGFEAVVSYDVIRSKDFNWRADFNMSYNKNEVKDLGGDDIILRNHIGGGLITTQIQAIKVGEPLGSFYLIPWEGIYQQDDAVLGYKTGDNKYIDVSGNQSIGYEDRVISGSAMPKVTLGFDNTFSYKNLDLNIMIQGAYGHKIFNATYAATAVPTSDVMYPTLKDALNYWTEQNRSARFANPVSATNKQYIESTQFLQDAGFTRIKNISLGYTLPKSLTKNYGIKLFVSGQNLFTFTKYKGFDPENSSTSSSSDADAGIDLGAYPTPKTITLGINVYFNK